MRKNRIKSDNRQFPYLFEIVFSSPLKFMDKLDPKSGFNISVTAMNCIGFNMVLVL